MGRGAADDRSGRLRERPPPVSRRPATAPTARPRLAPGSASPSAAASSVSVHHGGHLSPGRAALRATAAPAHRAVLRGDGAAGSPMPRATTCGEWDGRRVLGRVCALLAFARCTFDRLFWIVGEHRLFQVTTTGSEHLAALSAQRRGAFLLGAHLGSFEAMRGVARRRPCPLQRHRLLQERCPHQRRAREAESGSWRSLHQRGAGNRLRPRDEGTDRARGDGGPARRPGRPRRAGGGGAISRRTSAFARPDPIFSRRRCAARSI